LSFRIETGATLSQAVSDKAPIHGYDFWLNTLNNRDQNNYRGMVCSFITSAEYQQRFSSVVTRSNADCGQ
jgi:hypothetical protein